MADRRATLWVTLKDDVSAGLNKIKSGIASLSEHWLGITLSIGGMIAAGAEAIKQWAEQEQAINRLTLALKGQGFYSKEYSERLIEDAEGIRKMTTYSKEAVLETMTLLTTFGLAGDRLRDTTKAALDLSTGLKIDLRTATMLLGKAWEGETATLGRYGIKVTESADRVTKFNQVIAITRERFGGQAQAEVNTYEGKIKVLGESFKNLEKAIGGLLAGPTAKIVTWMTTGANAAQKFIDDLFPSSELQKKQKELEDVNASIRRQTNAVSSFLHAAQEPLEGDLLNPLLAKQKKLMAEIKLLQDKKRLEQQDDKQNEPSSKPPKFDFDENAYNVKLAQLRGFHGEAERLEMEHQAKQLDANGRFDKATLLRSTFYHQAELKGAMSFFQNLSALQGSKHKELAAVGKAAAVSQATIQTYLSATEAYAAMAGIPVVGPALGTAAAAAAIIAGMANVAKITGVQFAEGGMAMPSAGGTMGVFAEAGRAEAVIPLDDQRTKQKLRDVFDGGSGKTVINISAGTIVADKMSIRDFAQRIDEELFRLNRNRRSVAF